MSVTANSKSTLGEADVIIQANGHAEESLGYPLTAIGERVGRLASGHARRFIPRDITDAGWLWVATACKVAQEQVASSSRGSVVDSIHPDPPETIVLLKVSDDESGKSARSVADDGRGREAREPRHQPHRCRNGVVGYLWS